MSLPFKRPDFKLDQERPILLASIGLSLLIWFFIKLSKNYETEKIIRIEYIVPDMMEFTSPPPSNLLATVSGSGSDLAKQFFIQAYPVIKIHVDQLPDRANQKSELISMIHQETGLDIININRSYLSFSIDSTATKKVPVRLNASVELKNDFFQTQPMSVTPDSILLAGPKQELAEVDMVTTVKKEFRNIQGIINERIPILNDFSKNVSVHPNEITLKVSAEQFTEKQLDIPISVLNAPQGFQINPSIVTVSCTVSLDQYDALTVDSFKVEVDLEYALSNKEQTNIPIQLIHFPEWIKSPRISPKVVEFLVVE